MNSALLSLWRRDLSEAVGKNFFELGYPPELAERLQRQIREVIETQRPIRDETPYTSAAGERQYEYIFVPVMGKTGAVESVAGSTRDITERKQSKRPADRARSGCGRPTAARTSSWRRWPTNSATRWPRSATACRSCGWRRRRRRRSSRLATMMERQLSQMVRLVDDLLDVSRISRGKLELRKERVRTGGSGPAGRRDQPPADRGERPRTDGHPAAEPSSSTPT